MTRIYIIGVVLFITLRVVAQDKLLVAGSGNPNIMLLDKQTGKVEWKHTLEKGEECNSVALTGDGNILYSYKQGAKLITWKHQVIWDYQTPDATELQSATLLQNGDILLGICGNPARLIEINRNGKKVNEVFLYLGIAKIHSQFRQVFQLRNKNYLMPLMATQKVLEVNRKGEVVVEYEIDGKAFSSLELKNGDLLFSCGDGHCYLVIDRKTGKEVKRTRINDIPGITLLFVGQILQLENRNLLICNWHGHTKDISIDEPQLIEIDKEGRVVWKLHDKKNVGKISAVCYLKDFRLPDFR